MKQYIVTVTVDVTDDKEDKESILRKVVNAVEHKTGFITWQVDCKKIKE